MPTPAENLRTAQANYAQQLVDLSDPTKRKVSYSVNGRSVSWTEYQRFLLDTIQGLEKAIAALDTSAGDGLGYTVTAIP